MANVGKLDILVGASISGLKAGLDKATKSLKGFAGSVSSSLGGLGGFVAGLGITAGLHSAAEAMDQTLKSADALGIGTEQLAGMHHAAELADISTEQLDNSLGKMLRTIAGAESGNKSLIAGFSAIGISMADLQGLSPDKQFGLIADKLGAIEDPAKRAAASVAIFGKSGMQLSPMFLEGSKSLSAAQTEAEKLNLTFSHLDHEKVDAAGDAITKLKDSFKGIFQLAVVELAGGVGSSAEQAAFKIAEIGRKAIETFKSIKNEVGFFIGTWSLQWERIKIDSAIVWNTLKAGAIGAFDSIIAGLVALGHNFVTAFENFPKIAVASWEAIKAGAVALYENIDGVFQDMGASVMAFADGTVAALKAAFNLENPLTAFRDAFAKTFSEKSSGAFAAIGDASSKAFADSLSAAGGLKEFESVSGAMGEAFQQGFAGAIDPTLDAAKAKILGQIGEARAEFDAMQAGAPGAAKGKGATTAAAATVNAVSSKLSAATQAGTTEGATAIFAAMSAKKGTDDSIARNTETTATNTDRIATAVENLQMPDFEVVEAF